MKNTTHILLALIVCVASVSAQKQSTRERDDLTGTVRTIRTEYFVVSKTTGNEEPLYGATICNYDIEGLKTREDHLTKDGFLSRQIFFSYDSQNRSLEEADYLGDGSLRQKIIYTYDNDNKTAEAAYYEPDGSLAYRVVFKFNLDYDLNELTGFQASRRFFQERVWVEAAKYDASGSLLLKYTSEFKNGRREITIQATHDSPEGQRTSEATVVYNCDANGKITGRYYAADGTTINKAEDRANVERIDNFDLKGNWMKRVSSVAGETRVEYRTITYY